jgi:hypothetical protein
MAGLDKNGFTPLSLTENLDALTQKLQEQLGGTTLDLSSQSFLGQLIGIISNGYADLWAVGQALYSNSYPEGASGVGVDNILAINNLTRLTAKPTVTNSVATQDSNGFLRYGFVCYGTAGTVIPAGTLVSNGAASPSTFAIDSALTIGPAANGVQTLYFTNQATQGTYVLNFVSPAGDVLSTQPIPYNADANTTLLSWSGANAADVSSKWTLSLGSQATANIVSAASNVLTAQSIQLAINAISDYRNVVVSGSVAAGFRIAWGNVAAPFVQAAGDQKPDAIVQSVSSYVSNLSTASNVFPFTDVQLLQGAQNIQFTFGANTPAQGMPKTGAQPIQPIAVQSSTLSNGSVVTSLVVQTKAQGNPAFAVGSATCTQAGAVVVLANQLTTIVNPINGFSSCENQLDCVTGRNVETDSQAISRLRASLGSAASGSLAAIIKKTSSLANVSQVVGSQNVTSAAQQVLVFTGTPSQGQFSLKFGALTSPLFAYNASATAIQEGINQLPGFEQVQVSVYGTQGFVLDFEGSSGRQAQPLVSVPVNTTAVPLTPYFGRSPHSVEIVVQGGDDTAIAQAILSSLPAGIGTYSNPEARTLASTKAGSAIITVADATNVRAGQSVEGSGIPLGTMVAQVVSKTVTMTNSATADASSVALSFDHEILLADTAGNPVSIGFSRPVSTIIYVSLSLVTDQYLVPGDRTSGKNAASQFSLDSVADIQQNLLDVINSTPIGGLIIANGSNSLGGSFRSVPGVVKYTLRFDRVNPPLNTDNLQLASNEAPLAESFYTSIDYDHA